MKIFIPGGCGYVGAALVPYLLADGHCVTVYDTQWFGKGFLPDNGKMRMVKGDIRCPKAVKAAAAGHDAAIFLASVSNNAMYAVNRKVTHAVNAEHFPEAAYAIIDAHVPFFIYASSAAVRDPSSDYAKDKLHCEDALTGTDATIVRSASVCGYSPRMRFDLTVNKMAHDAYKRGVITVNGGNQKRSHIHIKDLCRFYRLLLRTPLPGHTINAVGQNQSVLNTAKAVASVIPCNIELGPRSDNRSYTVSGRKARDLLGFSPVFDVKAAAQELLVRFESDKLSLTNAWRDSMTNPVFQNIAHGLR